MKSILSQFHELNIDINPTWLQQTCAASGESIGLDSVYQLLMYSDLRESLLPPSRSADSFVRHLKLQRRLPKGCILVQVQTARDISVPSQHDDVGVCSPGRLLMLTLNSGPLEFQALELQPLTQFKDGVDIGVKFLMHGSPILQDGIVMLRPENVSLVGGEMSLLNQAYKDAVRTRKRYADPLQYRPANPNTTLASYAFCQDLQYSSNSP
jgi:hypothetical protein